ncbi:hypothetical protein BMS3Abin02_01802 [bacterium BMS3Abin02]|nr:hypothetical protein BMS3Abin02_01802 [bacterium BMS3Abin02]
MSTRRLGLFAAWLAATLLAIALASQAVGLVRDQVTDRPSRTVSTLLASATTPSTAVLATTPTDIDLEVPQRTTSPTSTTASTVPSVTAASTTTTSATTAPTTTPTTTAAPTLDRRYTLVGGWVTVACSGDDISFKSAAPKPGFSVERTEVEENKVDVKFESSDHTSRFEAECSGGNVVESIEEKDEQGDD